MKKQLLAGGSLLLAISLSMACGDSSSSNSNSNTNHNTNTNSNGSMMGNAANSMSNTMSSAANSVSNAASSVTTASPESFVTEAAQGGMTEVELGKLASQNAQDPEVKKFGQMMVTDHTKANDELKAVAGKRNFKLPTDLGSSNQSTVDKMKGLKGADFDKQYVDDMVSDHETDVSMFQKQAENGTDPDIKAFAAKTLPTLQKHLDAIKAIQAKMKNK